MRIAGRWGKAAGLVALCAVLGAAGATSPAWGQTPAQKAQAQVLFDEGRDFITAGKTAEACNKFAASYGLDPTMGTQLNLAVCYEKLGKTASAWILFVEIQTTARRGGQRERADFARDRAKALTPQLSKLKVHVTDRVPELAITIDGEPLTDGAWDSHVPVDPGERTIVASAPGWLDWTKKVTVGPDAARVDVTVPALEAAPAEPVEAPTEAPTVVTSKPDLPPDQDDEAIRVQTALGWSATAVGAGAVVAGVALRAMALSKNDESNEHCLPDDPSQCTQEGADLRDEAQGLELGSIIAWAGGGALLATGVLLLLLDSSDDDDEPTAGTVDWWAVGGPDRAAVQIRVHW